jgi:metallophosphoesterase (TIGR00282 family)
MNLLMIGDVIGEPGRRAVAKILPGLREDLKLACVVANVENLAGGFGVTLDAVKDLRAAGVDVLTSGNHIWDKKQYGEVMQAEPNLLRPANYPAGSPGKGSLIFNTASGTPIGVLNLQGRAFMAPIDDPFKIGKQEVASLRGQGAKIILVDVHAEATAEKVALSAYLDGEITACAGTHTHVPTADARLTAKGTACITDLGMTGPYDSVIGMDKDIILKKFLLQIPIKYEVAKGDLQFWALLVEADEATGKAAKVDQIHRKVTM